MIDTNMPEIALPTYEKVVGYVVKRAFVMLLYQIYGNHFQRQSVFVGSSCLSLPVLLNGSTDPPLRNVTKAGTG
jgi:hypothetical protein